MTKTSRLFTLGVLLLAGCATTQRIDMAELRPAAALSNQLPFDAPVIVYIAAPHLDKDAEQLGQATKREAVRRVLHQLERVETSLDVANKYFSDVNYFRPDRKASLFVLLSGTFDIQSGMGGRALTARIRGRIYDASGKLLFSKKVTGQQEIGLQANEASLYNAIARAQVKFYNEFLGTKAAAVQGVNVQATAASLRHKLSPDDLREVGTASGFVINGNGAVLTNYHAINNCLAVNMYLDGEAFEAKVKNIDKESDLALLQSDMRAAEHATFADARQSARLGEDIIVVGYPLQGVLTSKPSLTTGTISALAGIKDDDNVYQITAPIQRGNSGGPLLNRSGMAIGVVQSKLDAVKVADYTGDIPQNVNFAIKHNNVIEFLKRHNVAYKAVGNQARMKTPDIADAATNYTVKLSCVAYVDVVDK